ncbi:hypothetical protein WOB59_00765 [Methylocystis sp. IM4]|uniref:hypothetical protein n=1 Tax=Methylocystis sp. IM4 TaxID=3136560 RepID=UPI00311A6549
MRILATFAVGLVIAGPAWAENSDQEFKGNVGQSNVSTVPPQSSSETSKPRSALAPVPPEVIERFPALNHLRKSGAQLFETGTAHGLRGVVARQGDEFMILQMTPDGDAVISGVQTDLSVDRLVSIGGGGEPSVTELGTKHGMRGLFVRNGRQFQVFYATPDGQSVIPGVMWDAEGKNITREQVAPIPGVTPTVTIGKENEAIGAAAATQITNKSALDATEKTTFGLSGQSSAPRLYVFVDPLCSYSVRALQQLQPLVARGRVQAAIIPLAVLDYEDNGASTPSALAMLSKPAEQMAQAWSRGELNGPASSDAEEKLRQNMAIAEAIGLRGTPTVIWRKADGSEGRIDGLPEDWNAVIASMEGENHAAR